MNNKRKKKHRKNTYCHKDSSYERKRKRQIGERAGLLLNQNFLLIILTE
jgi:hypothetical protein